MQDFDFNKSYTGNHLIKQCMALFIKRLWAEEKIRTGIKKITTNKNEFLLWYVQFKIC